MIYTCIKEKMEKEDPDFLVDETGFGDYQNAIKVCFGIDYNKYWQAILLLMQHFKINVDKGFSLKKNGQTEQNFDLSKDVNRIAESAQNLPKFGPNGYLHTFKCNMLTFKLL